MWKRKRPKKERILWWTEHAESSEYPSHFNCKGFLEIII